MSVMLVVRDLTVSSAVRERVEELSSALNRFFHEPRKVSWNLRQEAGAVKASCSLVARSGEYRAHASHPTARGAVDLVHDKLVTQRRRVKMKQVAARRAGRARD